jgi:membrane protease YdiL (CAAX protease family)
MKIAITDRQKTFALLVWRTVRDMALAFVIVVAVGTVLQEVPTQLIIIPVAWIVFFQFANADRGPNSEWALFGWRPLRGTLIWVLLAIVPMMVFADSANVAYPGTVSEHAKEVGAIFNDAQKTPLGALFVFIVAVLTIPFIEESFFRGRILGWFRQHMHTFPAVLLTALLFSLVHFRFDLLPIDVLDATIFGVAVVITRSVWSSVVLHAAVNASLINIPRFGQPARFIVNGRSEGELIAMAAASFAILICLGFAARRTRRLSAPVATDIAAVEYDLTAAR